MASGTALIYDEEMRNYKLLWVDPACSIETPERLTASHSALQSQGLAQRCVPVPVRQATEDEILLAHSKEYLEAVNKTPGMTLEELKTFTLQYGDVYFHPNIYHCAKLAVGAVLQLVDSVITGQVRNGMALVRPPGHHSQRSVANGFCVFNNVAIAVLYAKKNFNINRVLIVDWDIHHGQGIQYLFEEDPSVLYFSWHRYEHQKFWPNLSESDYDTVGTGKGAGFNINLPWNKVGMENADYLSVFFHVLLPIAYEFSPDLVMVSAGFDSAVGDPEGHMCATPDVFAHLTHLLMPLAGGRLCVVLEGGYNLKTLSQSVCQTVQSLLGDPVPMMPGLNGPCESAVESIQNVRAAHQQYWGCLKHIGVQSVSEPSTKRSRVGEGDEGVQETPDAKEAESWVGHYPEPPLRVAPPTRTAVVLPADLEDLVPQSCQRVTGTPLRPEQAALGLREPISKALEDEKTLLPLGHVFSLLDKILKREVRNGMAVVPDVCITAAWAAQRGVTTHTERVLLVILGDSEVPLSLADDGKVLLVHVCSKEPEDRKSTYHVPVCLKKISEDPAGFLLAVLSLIVPIAYEFCPGLVLAALGEGSGIGAAVLAHFTSLLQGLAQGQLLCLIQEGSETKTLQTTSASLLGEPAPYLGPLAPALPENSQAVERQRRRLQKHWRMLQTAVNQEQRGTLPEGNCHAL
ncbi:polyamine deacetylase HDAC10 isoform X1 [Lepisosteus oculatus]|uniref:polyamine deacetylase HDAC10 isoform X1 n=2 Tax=Lepisosteus oculatus TaxID=7918 RepID=UPI00371BDD63